MSSFSKESTTSTKRDELIDLIKVKYPDILNFISLEDYIKLLEQYPRYSLYKHTSKAIKESNSRILEKYNHGGLTVFLKLLLVHCIELSMIRLDKDKVFPDSISKLFEVSFERLLRKTHINEEGIDYYTFDNSRYCKDLCIARMKLIPLGPQFAYLSRVSLGFLFRHRLDQFYNGMRMLFDLRGIGPVYRMHMFQTDTVSMSLFNEKGWEQLFINAALLLLKQKDIKAIIGTSWFFDRKLNDISPQFRFILKQIKTIGCYYFYQGSNQDAIKNALYMSHDRRKLFDEGRYLPTNYFIVIPRKNLIRWYEDRNAKMSDY